MKERGLVEAIWADHDGAGHREHIPRLKERGLVEAVQLAQGALPLDIIPRLKERGLVEAKSPFPRSAAVPCAFRA